jgi:ubiquinone/menaquinone biosynthesis C-methylase UbiE
MRAHVIAAGDPRATDTVADLGAGTGLLTLGLAERVDTVWAIDRSRAMGDYLAAKAASADADNVRVVHASVTSIPLVDESVDLVVSSYCFHELSDADKRRALAEVFRIAVPGGRVVIADMMFSLFGGTARDRRVIGSKVRQLLARGAPGAVRLAKNALRLVAGRWERPVSPAWWERALAEAGFEDVRVPTHEHEIGIAAARRPARAPAREELGDRARSTTARAPRAPEDTRGERLRGPEVSLRAVRALDRVPGRASGGSPAGSP